MVEVACLQRGYTPSRKIDRPKRGKDKALEKLCSEAVDEVYEKKLKEIIDKTKPGDRPALKEVLLAKSKVPRGVFPEAAELTRSRIDSTLLANKGVDPAWVRLFTGYGLEQWRTLIDAEFDTLCTNAWMSNEDHKRHRSALHRRYGTRAYATPTPIKKLLRSDLEGQDVFLEVLSDAQRKISKDLSEVSDAVQKIILHFAAKGVPCGSAQQQKHVSTELSASVPFCIRVFVPRQDQVRTPSPAPLFIRPLDGQRQRILDLVESSRAHKGFLSPDHCLHIYRRLFPDQNRTGSTALQREWDEIIQDLVLPLKERTLAHCIRTAEVAVIEFSARLMSQWRKGTNFIRSLDSLCLVLLQLHLSPNAEEKAYRANLSKKEDDLHVHVAESEGGTPAHEHIDASSKASKGPAKSAVQSSRKHSETEMIASSARVSTSSSCTEEKKRFYTSLRQDKQKSNIGETPSRKSKSSIPGHSTAHSESKGRVKRSDSGDADSEPSRVDSDTACQQQEGQSEAEPCKINMLKESLKRLVLADSFDGSLTPDNIINVIPAGVYTEREVDTLCQLANTLRPYSPRKTTNLHPLLTIPFVVMANAVLKATGYPQYVQEVSPNVQTDQCHPITLKSHSLFEVLCKPKLRLYSVKSEQGPYITSLTAANKMEEELFYAFFDRDTIREIGETSFGPSVEFRKRIVVDSQQNATLEYLLLKQVGNRRIKE